MGRVIHLDTVIGHHLIFMGYGHWLSNDPRGSGSSETRKSAIDELGAIHYGRKPKQPDRAVIRAFYDEANPRLDHSTLWFTEQMRQAIADAFAEVARNCGYTVWAFAVLQDHAHAAVRVHRDSGREMWMKFAAVSYEALHEARLVPPDHPVWSERPYAVFKRSVQGSAECGALCRTKSNKAQSSRTILLLGHPIQWVASREMMLENRLRLRGRRRHSHRASVREDASVDPNRSQHSQCRFLRLRLPIHPTIFQGMPNEKFPIDLKQLKPLKLDPAKDTLTDEQKKILKHNIDLCRDAIVFFTALAGAKGLSGHTGGAYDTVPEVMIIRAFIDNGAPIVPIFFDEAGHRVATQYLLSVLNGAMPAEKLLHYREYNAGLPGHPERLLTPGVEFSSGRLGHMWAYANGVAMANPGKSVIVLGSDGSQMEGDNAEAARLSVGKQLNVKLLVDDNNVTIAGHPNEYMIGFDLSQTLGGYGLRTETVMGEDLDALYTSLSRAFSDKDPHAMVIKRKMAPGIEGAEGSPHAHEVLKAETAINYLQKRGGYDAAIEMLKTAKTDKSPLTYKGSTGAGKNRDDFGKIINEILDGMSAEERLANVRVFDNDLEGSCGLVHIRKKHPDVFIRGGIMERGNFSAAAGFGSSKGKLGIFATFSAFLEMCVSEITMSRLNFSNVLAHFSHSGVDDMADNTCHFGINSMFADGGVQPGHGEDKTRLYFPADQHQFAKCVKSIFKDEGLRFIFSTRAPVPDILTDDKKPLFAEGYTFKAGVDDLVRDAGNAGGYVVSFGETLYRALDAVITLGEQGKTVGLVNKSTLNVYDEAMMKKLAAAPFVLVAEGYNVKTGLGSRFGSELLKRGFKGKYNHIGTHKEGSGGLWQQMGYQGLDPEGITKAIKALM